MHGGAKPQVTAQRSDQCRSAQEEVAYIAISHGEAVEHPIPRWIASPHACSLCADMSGHYLPRCTCAVHELIEVSLALARPPAHCHTLRNCQTYRPQGCLHAHTIGSEV